jgi:hypothetical protein
MELHMTAQDLEVFGLASDGMRAANITTSNNQDEEFSIPLDISDIINICREYNKLGWQIQNQVENILEVGVEESIKTGIVKQQSLPHIKSFLRAIGKNAYFGDAVSQAHECIELILDYEDKHKISYTTSVAN